MIRRTPASSLMAVLLQMPSGPATSESWKGQAGPGQMQERTEWAPDRIS